MALPSTGASPEALKVPTLRTEAPRGRSEPIWTRKVTTASAPAAIVPAGWPGEFTRRPEASGWSRWYPG